MPVFEIEANGKTYEVEAADASAAVGAIKGMSEPERSRSPMQFIDETVRQAANAVPVIGGALNKVEAARRAVPAAFDDRNFSDVYSSELDALNTQDKNFEEDHPAVATGAQLAGAVAGTAPLIAAAPVAMGVRGASLAGRAISGAASGAGLGAADAVVRSEGDAAETAKGALVGGALGGAAPVVAKAVGAGAQALNNRQATLAADATIDAAARNAPTSHAIKDASNALYQQARASGITVKPEAFNRFASKLSSTLKAEGANAKIHKDAAAFVDEVIGRFGKPQNFEDLDALRSLAGDVAGSSNAGDRRLGVIIKNTFDDWAESLGDDAVSAGTNPRETARAWRQARELWGQNRRAEMIEKIMRDAELSASGYEVGLRNGFRALAKNDKAMRGFSEIEKRAIRAVVAGTPSERVLRLVGKAAPSGIVSTTLSAALGGAAAGPVGAVGLPAAGAGVKTAADAMTRRAAERAAGIVRMPRAEQRVLAPPPRQVNQESIGSWATNILLGARPSVYSPSVDDR